MTVFIAKENKRSSPGENADLPTLCFYVREFLHLPRRHTIRLFREDGPEVASQPAPVGGADLIIA